MGPHFVLFPQSIELWPTPKILSIGNLQRDSLRQQNWLPMAQSSKRFAAVGQRLSLLSHVDTQYSLAADPCSFTRTRPTRSRQKSAADGGHSRQSNYQKQ